MEEEQLQSPPKEQTYGHKYDFFIYFALLIVLIVAFTVSIIILESDKNTTTENTPDNEISVKNQKYPELDFTPTKKSLDFSPSEAPTEFSAVLPQGAENAFVYGNDEFSTFYRIGDTVNYYHNGETDTLLPIPDADADTFTYLSSRSGYDKQALYKIDQTASGGNYSRGREYQVFTTPIDERHYELLQNYEAGDGVHVAWRTSVEQLTPPLQFSNMTGMRDWQTRIYFTTITDTNGAMVDVLTSWSANPARTFHAVDGMLVVIGNEAIYTAKPTQKAQKLASTDSNKIAYNFGENHLYFTDSFGSPGMYKLDLTTGLTTQIFGDVAERYHRSTRIGLTPDGSTLFFRGIRFQDPDDPMPYSGERIDFIEIDTTTLATTISDFGSIGKGGLHQFAMSPNNQYLYATYIPYEGYSFRELRYHTRNLDGTWKAEPIFMPNIHTEVGGGWNIDTNQWLLSPDKTHLVVSDTDNLESGTCPSMGDTPPIQNQIKLLNLDTQQVRLLTSAGPLNEYNLQYWEQDGSGVYFTLNTYGENDCAYVERGEVQFLPITY